MIKLKYGKYVNGVEQILEERDFRPIKFDTYKSVETNDFRDLRGEIIRNILYEKQVVEIVIGYDEYLSNKDFLENFFSANLTKITIGNTEKICKNVDKGRLTVNEQEKKKIVKLKLEVE